MDPFAHHPELRGRIADPETSFFRDFSVAALLARFPELTALRDWAHPDAAREAIRAAALDGHAGDLWVFGYGSLMWDPAIRFAEVRRATAPAHARRFVLFDDMGGRGTEEAPGLMAALAEGPGCEGLAFRLPAEAVEAETRILFARELLGPAYVPARVPVLIDGTTVPALAFLADPAARSIRLSLTRPEQVRLIARGAGILGTSRDYLASVVAHLALLGLDDPGCAELLAEVDAVRAAEV